jgi:hypothetical protein
MCSVPLCSLSLYSESSPQGKLFMLDPVLMPHGGCTDTLQTNAQTVNGANLQADDFTVRDTRPTNYSASDPGPLYLQRKYPRYPLAREDW